MKRVWKYLRRLLYVVVLVYGILFFLLSTQAGTRLLLAGASFATSKKLQVGETSGTIASGLAVNHLAYHDTEVNLTAERITLKIDLASLLRYKLFIKEFVVTNADLKIVTKRSAPTSSHTSFNPPAWLECIDADHIEISNFKIIVDKTVYDLKQAVIRKSAGNTYQYTIHSNLGELIGTASYNIYPILSWDVVAEANQFTIPDRWSATSAINAIIETNGTWGFNKTHAAINIEKLSGNIDGKNVSGSAKAAYDGKILQVDQLHLQFGNANLEASGFIGNKMDFKWNVNAPDLSTFFANFNGRIISEGSINGTINKPTINAHLATENLDIPDLSIKHFDATIKTIDTDIKNFAMTIAAKTIKYKNIGLGTVELDTQSKLSSKGFLTTLTGHIDQTTKINGTFDLPEFTKFANPNLEVSSVINLETKNLASLPITIPMVNNLGGQLNASFTLKGLLTNLQWALDGKITNGQFKLPDYGTDVRNVSSNITWSGDKPLELNGKLNAGKGNAIFNGNLTLIPDDYHFTLTLSGQQLTVANTHEFNIIASPDLTFSISKASASLTGKVAIPKAEIHPVDFTKVKSIPEETTFVQQKKSESTFFKQLTMDIQGELGDDIHINYSNLNTKLSGKLRIQKSDGAPLTGIGELSTKKGRYKAFGSDLRITTGRLIYTGNVLPNPGLDIVASKEIRRIGSNAQDSSDQYIYDKNLTVGIQVHGTIDKPELSYFSSPAGLGQNDILSYLVFGAPKSKITSANGLALLNSLGSSGNVATNITNDVQKTLGLTELGMSSTDYYDANTNQTNSITTVSVGKKITKNISLHYSVGLLTPVSVLNLVYKINRHLKLQAETSTIENGADLVYTIERG